MNRNSIKYIYEKKRGTKEEFLKNYTEEDYKSLIEMEMMYENKKNEEWKIKIIGYKYALLLFPEKKYEPWIDRVIGKVNSWLFNKKTEEIRKQKEKEYFEED